MNDLVVVQTTDWNFAHFKDENNKRWYDLGRIAKSLGVVNVTQLADRISDKHKRLISIKELRTQVTGNNNDNDSMFYSGSKGQRGGARSKWFVDDPGMYQAIICSNSPKAEAFTEWVTATVLPAIISTGTYSITNKAPAPPFLFHIRARQNQDRVPETYFSVISELVIVLYGKLEMSGYSIAEKDAKGRELRPDISVGKLWITWLNDNHPELAHRYKDYMHLLPNGKEVPARMYELDLLPKFRLFVHDVWIKEHGYKYFMERDPKALDYLIKLIPDMRIPAPAIEDRQPQLQQR